MTMTLTTSSASRSGDGPISKSAMGAEFLGWEAFEHVQARHDSVPFGHLRWPGGIPVEDGIDKDGDGKSDVVFDLRLPNLVDWQRGTGEAREGLRETMGYAVQQNMSFSMILPTARYVEKGFAGGEATALAQARADVHQFIVRLAGGEFGALPSKLILEIGSEYYSTDTWLNHNRLSTDNTDGTTTSTVDLASRFGNVYAAIADEIRDTITGLGAAGTALNNALKVAVQLGRIGSNPEAGHTDGQPSDNSAFIEAFENAGALDAVDAVIWHRYVPTFNGIDDSIRDFASGMPLEDAIRQWTEARGGVPVDFVGGWLSPSAQLSTAPDFGAPGLTNILQQFATLASAGMDYGSIYALGFGTDGSLGYRDQVFIGGQLYGMMVESLAGTWVQEGFEKNTPMISNGAWIPRQTANSYVFENADKVVIFLAAGDFSGDTLTQDLMIEGAFTGAKIQHLRDPNGIDTIDETHIGVVGELTAETALALTRTSSGTSCKVTFQDDFEVIRIVLTRDKSVVTPPFKPDRTIIGTTASETLNGTTGVDSISGGGGNDTIWGDMGNDRLYAAGGADKIYGEEGNDLVRGGDGTDLLRGSDGNDTIYGDTGADTLHGDLQDDLLYGGADNDSLSGGYGVDDLRGEAGLDTLLGGAGTDTLDGGTSADRLYGEDDADVLNGGDGNDTLDGGDANDRLWGGRDQDSLLGGLGNDWLYGGAGNDSLLGQDGNDLLWGDASTDKLWGGAGVDMLAGGSGSDSLYGDAGNDILIGGAGLDRLEGGAQDDNLTGGLNADSFVFTAGKDEITDFRAEDRILIDDALWAGVTHDVTWVLSRAHVTNGDTIFDFGNGNLLTVDDWTNIAGLAAEITII
ncbi:hypothetical protein LAZ40_01425 [Cereibacter sphaeroides]|uniref:calcium-binding protein n=1 Tax=Cereibacter sphaeroides TaxID=1063 RepID=UPI001F2FE9D2|nr:calcium-binding protein [Cereibacter sphaeroides]MCE6957720.1 hypothetical protein [Cereibacter sphaeroides]MCE6971506.1 hypothetical protein [Cereibacter sphaeroides]